MLSERIRPWSAELAEQFASVTAPITIAPAITGVEGDAVAIADAARAVVLAGPGATVVRSGLHALADRLGAPVANTWGAKGIYAWDDPHHMGTCGLQRDDFPLLGFAAFDIVVAVGIDLAESPVERFALTDVVMVDVGAVDATARAAAPRPLVVTSNDLYTRVAAIAQPGYLDDSTPRHPARAVMDLKQSLGPHTRVTAQPGAAGLWIARTFPTDRMGSVVVPAVDRPGVGAAVGLVSAGSGADTVCVVADEVDEVTAAVLAVAIHHDLPLRVEVWDDHVDWSRTEDLIAAAGPVVAWTP